MAYQLIVGGVESPASQVQFEAAVQAALAGGGALLPGFSVSNSVAYQPINSNAAPPPPNPVPVPMSEQPGKIA